VATVVSWC